MEPTEQTPYTAFAGLRRIASGPLEKVAVAAKEAFDRDGGTIVLVFDDSTAEQIGLDFSVEAAEAVERFAHANRPREGVAADEPPPSAAPRGPGRPRLGVVAREVTLLPRHWEWLSEQPGGASVALRKLVEHARKANQGRDRQRHAQEAAFRFMSAVAGNLAGFEDAIRALFAADHAAFGELVAQWPPDVSDYALKLAAGGFATTNGSPGPGHDSDRE